MIDDRTARAHRAGIPVEWANHAGQWQQLGPWYEGFDYLPYKYRIASGIEIRCGINPAWAPPDSYDFKSNARYEWRPVASAAPLAEPATQQAEALLELARISQEIDAAPIVGEKAEPPNYIQHVPDDCNRIIWRGSYYGLPLAASQPAPPQTPVPTDEQIVSLYHAKYHQAPDEDYVQGWHDCAAARPQAAAFEKPNWERGKHRGVTDFRRDHDLLRAARPQAAEPGDERARFEAHIRREFPTADDELLLGRSKSGSYGSMVTEHAWRAWCAALAPAAAGGETP